MSLQDHGQQEQYFNSQQPLQQQHTMYQDDSYTYAADTTGGYTYPNETFGVTSSLELSDMPSYDYSKQSTGLLPVNSLETFSSAPRSGNSGGLFLNPIQPLPQNITPLNLFANEKEDFFSKTRSWASSKGIGWLLELEDDDENDQKPLLEELDIDFLDIFRKIKSVLLPYKLRPRDSNLTAPDFWGPFFIVLLYAFLLLWGQLKAVSWVFTMWLCGSFIIYFFAKLMGGGEGGYAEVLAVTGYSLIPLVLLVIALPFVHNKGRVSLALKVMHTLWCTYASTTLLVTDAMRSRQLMIAYPILLLYTFLVALHSGV